MKNTNRQRLLRRLEDSITIQCAPLHYNGYALDIVQIHRGIVKDLILLPVHQQETCLEDLSLLIAIAEQFCQNHPLQKEKSYCQIYQDFFPNLSKQHYNDQLSTIPFGWLQSETLLERLYIGLVNYNRIRCQGQSFKRLFGRANNIFHRVWWHGPLTELVYLIKSLVAQHCIPIPKGGNIIKAITQNFCNSRGELLKATSLSTLDTRGMSSSSNGFADYLSEEVFHSVS